jgi:hypothetical protein
MLSSQRQHLGQLMDRRPEPRNATGTDNRTASHRRRHESIAEIEDGQALSGSLATAEIAQ